MGKRSVCVIGAGAAGLLAAFELDRTGEFDVKIFERNSFVGGVWGYRYSPSTATMYKNLRTNLPKEVMVFGPEYPYPAIDSFMTSAVVQDYVEKFVDDHSLKRLVTFSTNVVSCRKFGSHWKVITSTAGMQKEELFDFLIVANGKHDVPYIPKIAGVENFRGEVMHSQKYDNNERFAGKRIVALGCRSSGTDIARECATVATAVHCVDRKIKPEDGFKQYGAIFHRCALKCVRPDGKFEFLDGSIVEADVLMFCTGYELYFPFLEDRFFKNADDVDTIFGVPRLYRGTFSIDDPTLVFLGLYYMNLPFFISRLQSRWFAAVFTGKVTLPCKEYMLEWNRNQEEVLKKKNLFKEKYFFIGDIQWDMYRWFATACGDDLPPGSASNATFVTYINFCQKAYTELLFKHYPRIPGGDDYYRRFNVAVTDPKKLEFALVKHDHF